MSSIRPGVGAALLVAVGALGGCHAHVVSAVSTSAQGVNISFARSPASMSTVQLTVANGSTQPICIDPMAYRSESFTAQMDQGPVNSVPSPAAGPMVAGGCDVLQPGAKSVHTIQLDGFSRYDTEAGRFCYNYSFSFGTTAGAQPSASGKLCE